MILTPSIISQSRMDVDDDLEELQWIRQSLRKFKSYNHIIDFSRYNHSAAFFFFSSTITTLSAGTPFNGPAPPSISSKTSSDTSPCTTISSCPWAFLVTDAPVANFWARNLAAFFKSMSTCNYFSHWATHKTVNIPNASRPWIAVTCFRLLRSMRLIDICDAWVNFE